MSANQRALFTCNSHNKEGKKGSLSALVDTNAFKAAYAVVSQICTKLFALFAGKSLSVDAGLLKPYLSVILI